MALKTHNSLYLVGSFLVLSAVFWKWGLKEQIANEALFGLFAAGLIMFFVAHKMDGQND